MQIFVCFVYGFVIEDPSRDINLYWQENDVKDKLRNVSMRCIFVGSVYEEYSSCFCSYWDVVFCSCR